MGQQKQRFRVFQR